MKRRGLLVILPLVAFVALVSGALAGDPSPTATNGAVLMRCDHSHLGQVDPILNPGQAQSAHLHDFLGNLTTDKDSTLPSLRAGTATCAIKSNLTAYWVPAVIRADGTPATVTGNAIYYRCIRPHGCETFPQGFRWVSGSPKNTNPYAVAGDFRCAGGGPQKTLPATCPNGGGFQLTYSLTSCWDGKHFGTPAEAPTAPSSYMASPNPDGSCPATHPVPLPQLTFVTNWGPDAVGGRLSSDVAGAPAGSSMHADVFLAWDSAALQRIVDRCLNVADDTPSSQSCRVDLATGSVVTNPGGEFVTK